MRLRKAVFPNRESIDAYAITVSPTFGFLRRNPAFCYSSTTHQDAAAERDDDLEAKLPLLCSGSFTQKYSDEKPSSIPEESEHRKLQFSGEGQDSQGCSLIQTIFNGIISLATLWNCFQIPFSSPTASGSHYKLREEGDSAFVIKDLTGARSPYSTSVG